MELINFLKNWAGEAFAVLLTFLLLRRKHQADLGKTTSEVKKIDVDTEKSLRDQLIDAWAKIDELRRLHEESHKKIHDITKDLQKLNRRLNRYKIFDTLIETPI